MSYPTHPTQSEPLSPEDVSRSVEPPLKPAARDDSELRIADITWFQFADHHGFEKRLDLTGFVNSRSRVFVSISEIGVFGGQWKPFTGLASMEVHTALFMKVEHGRGCEGLARGLRGREYGARDVGGR